MPPVSVQPPSKLPVWRRALPFVALALMAIVVVGYAAFLTFRFDGSPSVAPSAVGGPFRLVAQDGRTVTQADFAGQPFLIFFGYSHCPDICPTSLFEMSQVLAKMGPDAKVRAAFVTVDPERDTPAVMKDYLSSFDPRILGLSGDRAATDAIVKAYRVYAKKIPTSGSDYTMDHTAVVYLMDKQGRFAGAFNLERTPETAAAELARYM